MLTCMKDVDLLMEEARTDSGNQNETKFQAMIFRTSHGWIPLELITETKLNETLTLAHDLFGVETMIFTTVPFSNNIQTQQEFFKK